LQLFVTDAREHFAIVKQIGELLEAGDRGTAPVAHPER
jgi:hypothetical protein